MFDPRKNRKELLTLLIVLVGAGAAAGPVLFGETLAVSETSVDIAVVVPAEDFSRDDVTRERALTHVNENGTQFSVDVEVESTGNGSEEFTVRVPIENQAEASLLVSMTLTQLDGPHPMNFSVSATGQDEFGDNCEIPDVTRVTAHEWRFHIPADCQDRLAINVTVPDQNLPAFYQFMGELETIAGMPVGDSSGSDSPGSGGSSFEISDVRDLDTHQYPYNYQPEVDVTESAGELVQNVTVEITITNASDSVVFQSQQALGDLQNETATAQFDVGELPVGDYEYEVVADGDSVDPDVVTGTFNITEPMSVAVESLDATGIGTDNATLRGNLTKLNTSSADVGFEWREQGTSTWQTTPTQSVTSTGTFSHTLTGLQANTTYEFRAVATGSDGQTDTGSVLTLTTEQPPMSEQVVYFEGSARTVPGDNSEFQFELSNTGSFDVEIVGIAVNSSTNGDYIEHATDNTYHGGGGYFDGRIDIGGPAEWLQSSAVIPASTNETFALGQFRQSSNGNTVNMVNDQVVVTLYFVDGSELQFTIQNVNPSG